MTNHVAGKVFADIDVSLDGFVAGQHVSKAAPLGNGGEKLIWYGDDVNDKNAALNSVYDAVDAEVLEASAIREGAVIMGRTTFEVSIDAWGHNPPIHKPCFVLTHRPASMIRKVGGTSFTFVTSLEEALGKARSAADGRDVGIMGGAQTIRQFMLGGLLDELHVHLVPVLLGSGIRLFDDMALKSIELRKVAIRDGRKVTHLLYEITKVPQ
jgi:dihydrofolate reductase